MNLLWTIFSAFFQVGLFSIGGGYATIPQIQRQIVESNAWLSYQEFTDMITLSQMTPGPLAVNASTFAGFRISGMTGAFFATFGCILPGFLLSMLLYFLLIQRKLIQNADSILYGLRVASTGLIASSACTILSIAFFGSASFPITEIHGISIGIFVLSLILLRKFHPNPILVLVISGLAGAVFLL